ncbi:hypothetical protein CHCC14819_2556 [Bacillus licheniformis]|nr:hypothetical protein CHCC14819_2556 [Bacillus licheniformis]
MMMKVVSFTGGTAGGWSLCRIARDSQGTQGSPYKKRKAGDNLLKN